MAILKKIINDDADVCQRLVVNLSKLISSSNHNFHINKSQLIFDIVRLPHTHLSLSY